MKIVVNGEPVETSAATLEALVAALGHDANVVATALNADFVPRGQRAGAGLGDGDEVEILAPMQGG